MRRVLVVVSFLGFVACSTSKLMTSSQQSVSAGTAALGSEQRLEPTEEDSRWSHLYRERALDELMPLKADRIVAAYRAAHTIIPSEMESYFAVDVGRGYGLHGATVVSPIGQSIGEQLIRLHRAEPGASFESVLSQIKVQRLTTDVERCPGLFAQMSVLHKVKIPMRPDPNIIRLDGTLHRIVTIFVDVSDNDDDNPAARWATQTLSILTKCVQAK